jgi:hypothetical protein
VDEIGLDYDLDCSLFIHTRRWGASHVAWDMHEKMDRAIEVKG